MLSRKTKGYLYGIIAAVIYGTNPLFALPLYSIGMNAETILFYRYALAIIIMGVIMKIMHQPFAIHKTDVESLFLMGIIFALSSLLLFMTYNYMGAGLATTMQYVYPIMVVIIMSTFLKEKITLTTTLSIILTLSGILLLYHGKGEQLSGTGTILIMLSALLYALYIVGINLSTLKTMSTIKLSFYTLVFGILVLFVRLRLGYDLILPQPQTWKYLIGLAIFPSNVSLICTALAIHNIGSTKASILGAFEPVTAVIIGVILFHETLTPRIILGIAIIISAVSLLVLGNSIAKKKRKLLLIKKK